MSRTTLQIYLYIGITLFLALAVKTGLSILCWECNSEYDRRCSDTFNQAPFVLSDCSQRYPNTTTQVCRKISQKVKGELRYIRTCGYLKDERGECYRRAGTFDVQIEYCQCSDKPGCNSAYSITSGYAMLLTMATSAIMFALTAH